MQPITANSPVCFEAAVYKGNNIIKVIFEYNKEWNAKIKTMPGATWSRTLQCWHVPDTETNRMRFKMPMKAASQEALTKMNATNQQQLLLFIQELQLKGYSPSTIVTYRNEFAQLLMVLQQVPVNTLTRERLRNYFSWCHTEKKLSENTLHSRLNAVKFYFEQVLKGEQFYWDLPRPKKPLQLPKVLGKQELRRLFLALHNTKHKAMLFTAYSAGLRVSEVVHLQLKHIDRERMQLLIENSKGKKDRYVGLSPMLLGILENYYKKCQPKPKVFVFEGIEPGQPYSARSAQKVFSVAKEKAGIKKEVSFHSLRHSFATHLLEKGIDIRYIKDILGHFDIHTTERYLHVRKDKLITIVSPLDDLWKDEAEW